jgi:hypothetical protein
MAADLVSARQRAYCCCVSYKTVEVELEQGQVRASGSEILPEKARALLVILDPLSSQPEESSGPSLADLMARFIGIGNGTHTDLSTNKAYLDGFGR